MLLAWIPVATAATHSGQLRVDPHIYTGARGTEPERQLVAQTVQRWRQTENGAPLWEIRLHLEAETQGRRDLSLDIDRAWITTTSEGGLGVALGRIHPWDLSLPPGQGKPWGQSAQLFPQNRGVLLGYGLSPDDVSPRPVPLGWIGAHLWSDLRNEKPVAFGVSATPFFLPSSGPDLSLSVDAPATTGRFGRRPPGFVELNGQLIPIRYEIDRSRLWRDVVLQPQLLGQARIGAGRVWQGWVSVARISNPTPTFDTSEYLQIRNEEVNAIAIVRPRFPSRWVTSLSQKWRVLDSVWGLSFVSGAYVADDKHWGYELGLENDFLSASYSNELTYGSLSDPYSTGVGVYGETLLQLDAKVPFLGIVWFSGAKTHVRHRDLWLRCGVRVPIGNQMSIDGGTDIFSGGENSYFGEWRTNDRFYAVFRWEIDR